MVTDENQFVILGNTEKVIIQLPSPGSVDATGWAEVRVVTDTPGFHAALHSSMMTWELRDLRDGLRQMYADLCGEVTWNAAEHFLDMTARMDRSGHLHWTIALMSYHATLHVEFDSDQSYLPALIDQMDDIISRFP